MAVAEITVHVADLEEVRNLLGQLTLERDAAQQEAAELASELVLARSARALELAELRESAMVELATDGDQPCCDHECAKPDEYDDDAPDDDSFICTHGHWHSPLVICSAPVGHGVTSFRRCPGGAL